MPRQKSWIVPVALEAPLTLRLLRPAWSNVSFQFTWPVTGPPTPSLFFAYHRLFNHKDHDIIIIITIIQFTNYGFKRFRVGKINYPLYLFYITIFCTFDPEESSRWSLRTTEIEPSRRLTTIVFTIVCCTYAHATQIRWDWNDRHASSRQIYIYAHQVLCSADVSRRKARRQMEVDRTTAVSKNLALNGGEKKVFARPFSLSPDSTPPPPPPPHHPTTFLHSACYTLPLPWCTGTSKASPPATSRLVPLTDW